jgi:chemotaxis protein CheD
LETTKKHFLYPSTIFVDRTPHHIQTVLGSCVSICVYDTHNHFGGMNHYMVSLWKGNGLASPKYGNIAIESLIDKMITLGCAKKNLIAKVFGGADVLENLSDHFQIGVNNIAIAMDMLDQNKIPITAKSTGGKLGRKITFNSLTGEVLMRYIEKQA